MSVTRKKQIQGQRFVQSLKIMGFPITKAWNPAWLCEAKNSCTYIWASPHTELIITNWLKTLAGIILQQVVNRIVCSQVAILKLLSFVSEIKEHDTPMNADTKANHQSASVWSEKPSTKLVQL